MFCPATWSVVSRTGSPASFRTATNWSPCSREVSEPKTVQVEPPVRKAREASARKRFPASKRLLPPSLSVSKFWKVKPAVKVPPSPKFRSSPTRTRVSFPGS